MKRVLDTSEILGIVESGRGRCELCAEADAEYDDAANQLVVRLTAFLRPVDILVKEVHTTTDWLPPGQLVRESVSLHESSDLARDIFHQWVRKVRGSAPRLDHC